MNKSVILWIDAVVNFLLGFLLILVVPYPQIVQFLGVPSVDQVFYPSIMGAVFIGIGIALVLEVRRGPSSGWVGLGLGGAVVINLCGGSVLIGWLLFGGLALPLRGLIFLWTLGILLVVVSVFEFQSHRR